MVIGESALALPQGPVRPAYANLTTNAILYRCRDEEAIRRGAVKVLEALSTEKVTKWDPHDILRVQLQWFCLVL